MSSDVVNPLTTLAAFNSKPLIENIWYNKKQVVLDGYVFKNTRFDNCTLVLTTGDFELIDCFIDDSTLVQFGGNVVNAIKLFNRRNSAAFANNYFSPLKNADGTITIRG